MNTKTMTGTAKQIIKATDWNTFINQLTSSNIDFRQMAYFGLWEQGAVLDVVDNFDSISGLKVGEKLEISMSTETKVLNPTLITSIHLCGNDIIVNGSENLFTFGHAEPLLRAFGQWMIKHSVKSVIFGGTSVGLGSWVLPQNGTPICLSTFGFGGVLPYEGYLFTRHLVTGECLYLSNDKISSGLYGVSNWVSFYTPSTGVQVTGFGHRVRGGWLYVTLRHGNTVTVEGWDLRPLWKGGKVITNTINMNNELVGNVDLVGPVWGGDTMVWTSGHPTSVTFWGVSGLSA